VLSSILNGDAITYSTGLAAINAYLCTLKPRKVAIGGGYHGTYDVLDLHRQLTGCTTVGLDQVQTLEMGDVIHLETPMNPSKEARNLSEFAKIAREKGLWLVVDSTSVRLHCKIRSLSVQTWSFTVRPNLSVVTVTWCACSRHPATPPRACSEILSDSTSIGINPRWA
jgi:hypothetical protein